MFACEAFLVRLIMRVVTRYDVVLVHDGEILRTEYGTSSFEKAVVRMKRLNSERADYQNALGLFSCRRL